MKPITLFCKQLLAFGLLLIPMENVAQSIQCLDIELSNYHYAYPSQHFSFESQKQTMQMSYMYEVPNQFNGKYVMLLHGKNFNGAYWRSTMQALLKEGFGVIVPDQIGFGKSTKPKSYQYTFQQLAENTHQILDFLNIQKVTVLGHSMGGMLATRFTLMYPEMVDQLILVNPIGLEDWKLKVPYKNIEFWYKNELKTDYNSLKEYQKESYYAGNWKPEYDEWVELLAGWTLNSQYPIVAYNNASTYDMIFTQPVLYEFPNIDKETLLIIGTRDRTALGKSLVSAEVRKSLGRYDRLGKITQKAIPNSQLVELPGVGHIPHRSIR